MSLFDLLLLHIQSCGDAWPQKLSLKRTTNHVFVRALKECKEIAVKAQHTGRKSPNLIRHFENLQLIFPNVTQTKIVHPCTT